MTRKKKKRLGRPPLAENRERTRNLVIRLSDDERDALDDIAIYHQLPNASEAFRFLVRVESEQIAMAKRTGIRT